MKYYISLFLLFFSLQFTIAQEEFDSLQFEFLMDSIENALAYETGRVDILDGDAYIDVPDDFKFLNSEQAVYVLTDLWGNPPSDVAPEGMLVPKANGVIKDVTYAIEVTYSEEGYIDDEDAKEIDYDELLEGIQEDTRSFNPERKSLGYPTYEVVGWAAPPHYDEATNKLYWAQELKFEDTDENTLNYNIRILGRRGLINLNAIGTMGILDLVEKDAPHVLASVHYNEGSKYSDFDSKYDKVAAVGIGGLIAGKVLAKAGILAKLGILLAKFWKIIAIAIFGLFAGVRRFFGGKDTTEKPKSKADANPVSNRESDQETLEE